MTVDLYHIEASGPCRSVRLVAAKIGLDLNLKYTDLMKGEHLKPEFLKMNPQHTVPTLHDNGFYLSESRAICTYLVERYGKDDSLYPKDPQKRAVVNQRLFFDAGTLYQSYFDYYMAPIWLQKPKDPSKLEKINEAFGFLDKFLEGGKYVAGDKLTVADIVILSSVSNFSIFDYDISKYQNVSKWFSKVKMELPKYEEINGEGLKMYKKFIEQITSGKKS